MLDDIQWEETSGVDYPANNEEGWLVMKNSRLSKAESEALRSDFGLAVGLSAVDGRSLPDDAGEAVRTLETYLRNQGFRKSFLSNLLGGGGLNNRLLGWILGRANDEDEEAGMSFWPRRRRSASEGKLDEEYGRLSSRERDRFRDRVLDTRGISGRQRASLRDTFEDEDKRGSFRRAAKALEWNKRSNGDWVKQTDTPYGTVRARVSSANRKYTLHTEAPDGKGSYNNDKQSFPTMRNAKANGDDFVERNKHRLAQLGKKKKGKK